MIQLAKGRQIVLPVVYNGEEIQLTAKMVSQAANVGNKKAISLLRQYAKGEISLEKVFKPDIKYRDYCYTKDGETFQAADLMKAVEGMTRKNASYRLRGWIRGEVARDKLFAPLAEGGGNDEWRALGDDERVDPTAIKVTQFEREYGERVEREWKAKATPYKWE